MDQQKYYVNNIEKIKISNKKCRHNSLLANPVQFLFYNAKKRARERNILFTISKEDIVFTKYCPILGIPLVHGKGQPHNNSPSLDRINPFLGYIPGNIAVISYRANTIKGFGTAEEHRKIADWIEKQPL